MQEGYPTNWSRTQIDALREVSHIGAGSAITALAQFINRPIDMEPTGEIIFTTMEDLKLIVGGIPSITVVISSIPEKVCGHLLIIFEQEEALALVKLLLGEEGVKDESAKEVSISAMKEVGTMMFGSYLTAMGNMTSLSLMITPPSYESGASNKVLEQAIKRTGKEEITMCFETSFRIEAEKPILGYILFIPAPISLSLLMKILGVENIST